ncbi:ornithine cyclodeaminase [Paraburkholderia sp. Tr-20389]|uniref:ornithine cyclodeaminase family protein n=1 Tax=Paraburkholderia sp. Tr-20389 TaxID=2703903 RepID=UPI001981AB05|nr:ornithine cyclodeaminase [Paraburkholderia sp. Tr-20389]MBN3758318.1 ornithine cyclodeaminase [Paraburkholderia sp. Tr-20389]
MRTISAQQIRSVLDWDGVLDALQEGHSGSRPLGDSYFIGDASFGLFSRGVILPGKGAGFKIASLYPANSAASPPLPTEQAAFVVLDEHTKGIVAALDGPEITRWKTAADSALAAKKLSRENSEVLLVLGAGPVAQSLTDAYLHIRPAIREVLLWNRTPSRLEAARARLEAKHIEVRIVDDLDAAVARADIVTTATSASIPQIRGKCVRPGTHVDLVGGYRPDMQEADCDVFRGARIFVDDRQNAAHSGDIQIPMQAQVIRAGQIEGDLFDLCAMPVVHRKDQDRTVYKNAGGAYLDLIISQYVVERLKSL